MSKLKDNLDSIGFNFEGLDQTEIDRKNMTLRKIRDIKSKQSKIETVVKLYNPNNKAELREAYIEYNKQIKKLEGELNGK